MDKIDERYQYISQDGLLFEKVIRTEKTTEKVSRTTFWNDPKAPKWVRQFSKLTCEIVPYNWQEISRAKTVMFLSDEVDVEQLKLYGTLKRANITFTCLPDNEWFDDYSSMFKGKDVIICLNKTDPSAASLATRLYDVAASVKIVSLEYKDGSVSIADWIQCNGNSSLDTFLKILDSTMPIDEDIKGLVLDEKHIPINRVLSSPEKYGRDYCVERIAGFRNHSTIDRVIPQIASALKMSPEQLRQEVKNLREIKPDNKDKKKEKQQEASETRINGLMDIAMTMTGQKHYLILEGSELKSVPFCEGKGERGEAVNLIPPYKTIFTLPQAEQVLELYGQQDPTLFHDLWELSCKYCDMREQDRLVMITTIMLSYLIYHPDISYVPIIMMVSPHNHGKSHILEFMTHTGFRGIWYRQFDYRAMVRNTDEFNHLVCIDVTDFNEEAKKTDRHDYMLGRIERGSKIQKVNNPSGKRYEQIDVYDSYGIMVIGSNTSVSKKYAPLLSRILMIRNIESQHPEKILKPSCPSDFIQIRTRLTAWKASMMNQRLNHRGYLKFDNRLWDMGSSLLQVANQVAPDKYDAIVKYLRLQEEQARTSKQSSTEAIVVRVIKKLFDKEAMNLIMSKKPTDEIEISRSAIITEVVELIPDLEKNGNRVLPKLLRDNLNLEERKRHIGSQYPVFVRVERNQLDTLLRKYGEENLKVEIPDTADELINTVVEG